MDFELGDGQVFFGAATFAALYIGVPGSAHKIEEIVLQDAVRLLQDWFAVLLQDGLSGIVQQGLGCPLLAPADLHDGLLDCADQCLVFAAFRPQDLLFHDRHMDMVRDAFAAFEQRMVTEDKDGVCYQRVSLDDVLPGEEQLRRIEAIADPYAMQPQSIMEEQESRRELYDGLKRLTQREQTYLLYRYGFTDGEEHPLIGTAIYFHLTKGRAKKTEEQAMDNLWLELPWWFI